MTKTMRALWSLGVCLGFLVAGEALAQQSRAPETVPNSRVAITTFNVPGANNAIPYSINDAGVVTGEYSDATSGSGREARMTES